MLFEIANSNFVIEFIDFKLTSCILYNSIHHDPSLHHTQISAETHRLFFSKKKKKIHTLDRSWLSE